MKLWIKHCCSCGARWLQLNKTLCVCALFVSPASESESDVSPEKRARVSEVPEDEESSSSSSSFSALSSSSSSSSSSRSSSKQRSRKRCHRCQTKLELVQQELGSCRCGKTFRHKHTLERARKHAQTHSHTQSTASSYSWLRLCVSQAGGNICILMLLLILTSEINVYNLMTVLWILPPVQEMHLVALHVFGCRQIGRWPECFCLP